jgi:hypothetical protein
VAYITLNSVVCILLPVLDQVQGFPSNATLCQWLFTIRFELSATCFGRTTIFKWKYITSEINMAGLLLDHVGDNLNKIVNNYWNSYIALPTSVRIYKHIAFRGTYVVVTKSKNIPLASTRAAELHTNWWDLPQHCSAFKRLNLLPRVAATAFSLPLTQLQSCVLERCCRSGVAFMAF